MRHQQDLASRLSGSGIRTAKDSDDVLYRGRQRRPGLQIHAQAIGVEGISDVSPRLCVRGEPVECGSAAMTLTWPSALTIEKSAGEAAACGAGAMVLVSPRTSSRRSPMTTMTRGTYPLWPVAIHRPIL